MDRASARLVVAPSKSLPRRRRPGGAGPMAELEPGLLALLGLRLRGRPVRACCRPGHRRRSRVASTLRTRAALTPPGSPPVPRASSSCRPGVRDDPHELAAAVRGPGRPPPAATARWSAVSWHGTGGGAGGARVVPPAAARRRPGLGLASSPRAAAALGLLGLALPPRRPRPRARRPIRASGAAASARRATVVVLRLVRRVLAEHGPRLCAGALRRALRQPRLARGSSSGRRHHRRRDLVGDLLLGVVALGAARRRSGGLALRCYRLAALFCCGLLQWLT